MTTLEERIRINLKAAGDLLPDDDPYSHAPDSRRPAPRARGVLIGAATMVGVLLILGGGVLLTKPAISPTEPAASITTTASEVSTTDSFLPRIIIDVDGFSIRDGDEDVIGSGDREGEWSFQINDAAGDMFIEAADVTDPGWPVGNAHRFYEIRGVDDSHIISWAGKGHDVTLRLPEGVDPASIAPAISYVDEARWIDLLPANFVPPSRREATIAEMLQDIDVPPDLDPDKLVSIHPSAVVSEYQLGADLTGSIACYWVEKWVVATESEDESQAAIAAEEMAKTRSWRVLQQMRSEGGWPDQIWQFAAAIAADGTVTMGKVLTVKETYQGSLGCT